MKLKDNPYCEHCTDNTIGTFLHMVWKCPEVNSFWQNVATTLSNILGRVIPHTPRLLLLNDTSNINLTVNDHRVLLAGLTAAKKTIALPLEIYTTSECGRVACFI